MAFWATPLLALVELDVCALAFLTDFVAGALADLDAFASRAPERAGLTLEVGIAALYSILGRSELSDRCISSMRFPNGSPTVRQ
jgi:hypothetical protein